MSKPPMPDSTQSMSELAQRVSEHSRTWQRERAKQLAMLEGNHFEHYMPGNIEEACASLEAWQGGSK